MKRSPKKSRKPTGFAKPSELDDGGEEVDACEDASELNDSGAPVAEAIRFGGKPQPNSSELNEGEEGEDEDPDDEEDQQQAVMFRSVVSADFSGGEGQLKKSASSGAIAGSLAVARRQNQIPSHLNVKKKPRPRKIPPPLLAWDVRHHLAGVENEMLPKKLRSYFEAPQTHDELRQHLEKRNNMTSMLKRMDEEEVPHTKPTPITSDSGPPVIPTKHVVGGNMKDRNHEERPWNNRWSQGIGQLNEGVHPLHREYFCAPSLFAEAPSQRWRRYADVELSPGVWKPILDKEGQPPRFPPLGV